MLSCGRPRLSDSWLASAESSAAVGRRGTCLSATGGSAGACGDGEGSPGGGGDGARACRADCGGDGKETAGSCWAEANSREPLQRWGCGAADALLPGCTAALPRAGAAAQPRLPGSARAPPSSSRVTLPSRPTTDMRLPNRERNAADAIRSTLASFVCRFAVFARRSHGGAVNTQDLFSSLGS